MGARGDGRDVGSEASCKGCRPGCVRLVAHAPLLPPILRLHILLLPFLTVCALGLPPGTFIPLCVAAGAPGGERMGMCA